MLPVQGPRLYVGGVPDDISEEQIVEHFNKWGNVVDVYFPGKKGAKRVECPPNLPLGNPCQHPQEVQAAMAMPPGSGDPKIVMCPVHSTWCFGAQIGIGAAALRHGVSMWHARSRSWCTCAVSRHMGGSAPHAAHQALTGPHVQVNYCFVTYDSFRSAQRACNQSERNIFGKVGKPCSSALHWPPVLLGER